MARRRNPQYRQGRLTYISAWSRSGAKNLGLQQWAVVFDGKDFYLTDSVPADAKQITKSSLTRKQRSARNKLISALKAIPRKSRVSMAEAEKAFFAALNRKSRKAYIAGGALTLLLAAFGAAVGAAGQYRRERKAALEDKARRERELDKIQDYWDRMGAERRKKGFRGTTGAYIKFKGR